MTDPLTAEDANRIAFAIADYARKYPTGAFQLSEERLVFEMMPRALATIDTLRVEAERLRAALALHWGEDGSQHTIVAWKGCHLCSALAGTEGQQ